ncbi:MAG: F0F1 ATP synthase subunit gamma, partial [Planctomycetes bacterium]|nr:F0F1 ATP synthase subunit gamma [Planctomycetota bacterium]
NTNIFRAVDGELAARSGAASVFIAIGKRSISHLRQSGRKMIRSYHDVFEKLSYIMAGDICETLVDLFSAGGDDRIDEAYVVYNQFVSMLTQRPVIRKLLPIDLREIRRGRKAAEGSRRQDAVRGDILEEIVLEEAPDDIFDLYDAEEELLAEQGEIEAAAKVPPVRPIYELLPNPRVTLGTLMARWMATEIYRGMLESYAAELAARMSAMDAASSNAEEMILRLTLDLNQARQTGITMELLDIIGGSNV